MLMGGMSWTPADGASALKLAGLNVSRGSGGRLGVPSLWSVRELLEVFINHSSNLFSHDRADTCWLLLQRQ